MAESIESKKIKVEFIDGRVVTSAGKRFYVPFPHPLPKVCGEISADLVTAIGPRKTSAVPPNINVGILPETQPAMAGQ